MTKTQVEVITSVQRRRRRPRARPRSRPAPSFTKFFELLGERRHRRELLLIR